MQCYQFFILDYTVFYICKVLDTSHTLHCHRRASHHCLLSTVPSEKMLKVVRTSSSPSPSPSSSISCGRSTKFLGSTCNSSVSSNFITATAVAVEGTSLCCSGRGALDTLLSEGINFQELCLLTPWVAVPRWDGTSGDVGGGDLEDDIRDGFFLCPFDAPGIIMSVLHTCNSHTYTYMCC